MLRTLRKSPPPEHIVPLPPQGADADPAIAKEEERDWQAYFSRNLRGQGIELCRPVYRDVRLPCEDESCDFIAAPEILERLVSPISGLREWFRILRPGGLLHLTIADKRTGEDRYRPKTTLEHLILDFLSPSADRDFEHYLEAAIFVSGKSRAEAIEQARQQHEAKEDIRLHVFSPENAVQLVEWVRGNVCQWEIAEGPVKSPGAGEFHLLLKKG